MTKKSTKEKVVAAPPENPNEVKFHGLTEEHTQAMGSYLISRPYHEVEKLVNILKNAPVITVNVKPQVPAAPDETPRV